MTNIPKDDLSHLNEDERKEADEYIEVEYHGNILQVSYERPFKHLKTINDLRGEKETLIDALNAAVEDGLKLQEAELAERKKVERLEGELIKLRGLIQNYDGSDNDEDLWQKICDLAF